MQLNVNLGAQNMKVRGITKEDIDSIINIINKNYDEVMVKTHLKDVLQKFREHNTFED